MQLVTALLATMTLSVCQLVQSTIMQTAWIANSVMSCVLVDVQGQGILLAREDAIHVMLSTLITMIHRCILSCVHLYVVQCMCAGGVQVRVWMARYFSVPMPPIHLYILGSTSWVSLQISCVAQCPVSTYRHQLEQAIGPVPESNGACHPCHDLCETCFGPLNTECFTCKFAAVENTTGDTTVSTCLDECPFDRYKAASKVCRHCHHQCDGCTGQGNKMCLQCKNVRVVVPQSQPPTTYECLASCPNISYWIDHDDNNTCIPCHYLCATCVGSSNSECTQCKAIQTVIIDLNRTVTVNGVDRTLYMCKATLGSSSGPEK